MPLQVSDGSQPNWPELVLLVSGMPTCHVTADIAQRIEQNTSDSVKAFHIADARIRAGQFVMLREDTLDLLTLV